MSAVETRYDKLAKWPKRRPSGIIFRLDRETASVYICDSRGARLLTVPLRDWPTPQDFYA